MGGGLFLATGLACWGCRGGPDCLGGTGGAANFLGLVLATGLACWGCRGGPDCLGGTSGAANFLSLVLAMGLALSTVFHLG